MKLNRQLLVLRFNIERTWHIGNVSCRVIGVSNCENYFYFVYVPLTMVQMGFYNAHQRVGTCIITYMLIIM